MVKGQSLDPKNVALTYPDTNLSFKQAFPFPGVVPVFGARGQGKTAMAMWVMERYYQSSGGKIGGAVYRPPNAMRKLLPEWVQTPRNLNSLPKGCVIVIDEAQQVAHARRSSSSENLELATLVALARQRRQLIFLVTHHSRKLDMLDIMEASRVVWKKPTAGHLMYERKETKPFAQRAFDKYREKKGLPQKWAYVMDFEELRFGFIACKMPTFWCDAISTGMADMANSPGDQRLL